MISNRKQEQWLNAFHHCENSPATMEHWMPRNRSKTALNEAIIMVIKLNQTATAKTSMHWLIQPSERCVAVATRHQRTTTFSSEYDKRDRLSEPHCSRGAHTANSDSWAVTFGVPGTRYWYNHSCSDVDLFLEYTMSERRLRKRADTPSQVRTVPKERQVKLTVIKRYLWKGCSCS